MDIAISLVPGPQVIEKLIQVRSTYPDSDEDKVRTTVRHLKEIPQVENRLFFVAEDSNLNPVAYVQLILLNADNDPSLASPGEVAHIHDLRVSYTHQRVGIGKTLLMQLEREAQKRHLKVLTLGVESTNKIALRLYLRLGYEKFKESKGRSDFDKIYFMRKKIESRL